MAEHHLFYYPYASFGNQQLPLLKVAALYFDKLFLLDPVGAGWNTIGADDDARHAIRLLAGEGILETVSPSSVLAKYAAPIADAVRKDLTDREFLDLCERQSGITGKRRWTLSLAKVPSDLQTDQAMRHLMGDFAREVTRESGKYYEESGRNPTELFEYSETGQAYDEQVQTGGGSMEYRYADFPLALGESIMMNHALFAGMQYAAATPVTDETFHTEALALKLRRAWQDPSIEETRRHKAALLAATALQDPQLRLPVLNSAVPIEEVLEYRLSARAALGETRNQMAWMARRIEAEPWSKEFARDLESKAIPNLANALGDAEKARDAWIQSKRVRTGAKLASLAVAAASVVLTVIPSPLTPLALATGVLSTASSVGFPGYELYLDWRDGKKTSTANGLHYLLGY